MAESNKMKDMPVNKLMIQMGIPMILSMALQAVYNIVDSAFVGNMRVGSEAALNALTLVFPVQMLMVAVGIGTGVGTNALLARTLGQGNSKKAAKVAGNSLFLGVIIYVVCLLFGIFGVKAYISSQTVDTEVLEMGVSYLRICCVISFGIIFFSLFEKLLQATGRSLYSTIGQVVGAVINIILDPIMIFGLFGFPAMGVAGAAIATVAGQMLACGLAVLLFIKKEKQIHISFKGFQFDKAVAVKIYSIGIPSCIMLSLPSLLVGILNALLTSFSSLAVAVFGLYYKFQSFVYMPENGIIQGMRPIMSYNYGAGYLKRMKETVTCSMLSCGAILAAGTVLFLAVPGPIMGMFGAEGEMLEMGISCLRLISLGFIFSAAGTVFCGCFEALGQGLYSLIVSLIRQLVVIPPLALALSKSIGLPGVWLSFPVAEILAAGIGWILYKKQMRQVKKEIGAEG